MLVMFNNCMLNIGVLISLDLEKTNIFFHVHMKKKSSFNINIRADSGNSSCSFEA